ncbi:MAG: DUF3343 domain-containing protein [Lachnospiraceae bacterium]|nr:DUF3343 domain-containing protein [Lachnospiraceae bacterium]
MNTYIATFYSHFGAVRFARELQTHGIHVSLGPVPRFLSSSCGTCAEFQYTPDPVSGNAQTGLINLLSHPEEIEQIVLLRPDGSHETASDIRFVNTR